MITTRHSSWRMRLLLYYVDWARRLTFRDFRLNGFPGWMDYLQSRQGPTVFYGNHQTWWDGLVDLALMRGLGFKPHIMMEEKNLRQYPYFRHCGVFGVDLDSAAGRRASLLYAVRLLRGNPSPYRAPGLVIYPHGRLVQPEETWPPFQDGVQALLKLVPEAVAIPVYHRFAFGKHRKPEARLEIGQPLSFAQIQAGGSLEESLRQAQSKLLQRGLDSQSAGDVSKWHLWRSLG